MFGLLNLNKPAGWTSRDAVNRVGRLAGRGVKVGHAGTLDPLATGVLVLCVGPATRLVPWIHDHLKCYEATFQMGCRSDTDDTDGEVQPVPVDTPPTAADLEQILPEFTGRIQQIPPAYSALKVNGRRAYALARAGEAVELAAREVLISSLTLGQYQYPEFRFSVECGTGTYIRSLGRDLARRLGTEAVMSSLVRTRVGSFSIENAISLEDLTSDSLPAVLQNPLSMLNHLPSVEVNEDETRRLIFGQTLPWPETVPHTEGTDVVLKSPSGQLIAIGMEKGGRLAPQNVFVRRE